MVKNDIIWSIKMTEFILGLFVGWFSLGIIWWVG